jgi:hypothetical protein
MPWSPKQTHYFEAVSHGWEPSDPKLKGKLSPDKAKQLLTEARQKALTSKGGK